MGGREKMALHGAANVTPTTSEHTSVTLKICSRSRREPPLPSAEAVCKKESKQEFLLWRS